MTHPCQFFPVGDPSGGGGGLDWSDPPKTSDFASENGKGYPIDTTSGPVTMQLPAAPEAGDQIGWKDYENNFQNAEFYADPQGKLIEGQQGPLKVTSRGAGGTLVFIDDTVGWLLVDHTPLDGGVVTNKPFMHVQERYAAGTDPVNAVLGETESALNTVIANDISGASLNGNVISLPAGDYYISAELGFYAGAGSATKAHGRSIVRGSVEGDLLLSIPRRIISVAAQGSQDNITVAGKFSLSTPQDVSVIYDVNENTGGSFGRLIDDGNPEINADVHIWKLDTEIKKITVDDPQQYLKKPLFQVCRIEPSGTATAGAGIEPLDTILLNEISGADLVANGLSLPAGEYTIDFWCGDQAGSADAGYMYLEDSSASRKSERFPTGKDHASMYGTARITLSSADVLYLRHVIGTSSEFTAGADTVYAWVKVWAESQVVQAPKVFQPVNQPISGAYVTGNIFGGELEWVDSTHINVKPVSCMSDDLTTQLYIDAVTNVAMAPAADTVYNFFIVRYNDASFGIEFDTDVNGANLPGTVTHKRWLGPLKTLAAVAEIVPFTMNEDVIWVNTMGEWVIKDAGWTNSWALINADIDAAIPTVRVKELVPGFWGAAATNTEIDLSADNATSILVADGVGSKDTAGRLAWTRDMYGPINPASPLYGRTEAGRQATLAVRTLRLKR